MTEGPAGPGTRPFTTLPRPLAVVVVVVVLLSPLLGRGELRDALVDEVAAASGGGGGGEESAAAAAAAAWDRLCQLELHSAALQQVGRNDVSHQDLIS